MYIVTHILAKSLANTLAKSYLILLKTCSARLKLPININLNNYSVKVEAWVLENLKPLVAQFLTTF